MANIVLPLSSLLLAAGAMAAIGPVTDLQITNVELAPDGYTREYVSSFSLPYYPLLTTLTPAPCLLEACSQARSLRETWYAPRLVNSVCFVLLTKTSQGDTFQINVIDELSDSNMLKTTSVVSGLPSNCMSRPLIIHFSRSIGMVYSNLVPQAWTVRILLILLKYSD